MVISPERSCGLIEKGLHTGNLAAAFAVIATTADLTLAGGAATLFGAALSGSALFKSSDRTTKKAAKDIAADLDRAIKDTHLTQVQILWVHQMVVCFPPTGQEFLDADMNGEKLTEILIKRITDTASDSEHKTSGALDAYRRVMPTVFQEAIVRNTSDTKVLSSMQIELLSRTSQDAEPDRRRREANQLMQRHMFEEMMESCDTQYSEMIQFLALLADSQLTVRQACKIIEDKSNG